MPELILMRLTICVCAMQLGLQADTHWRAQRVETEDSGGIHYHPDLHTIAVPYADPCRHLQQQIWSWLPWHRLWNWRSNAQGWCRTCSCCRDSCLINHHIQLTNNSSTTCILSSMMFKFLSWDNVFFFPFSFGLFGWCSNAFGVVLLHVKHCHFVVWQCMYYEWLQLNLYLLPLFCPSRLFCLWWHIYFE